MRGTIIVISVFAVLMIGAPWTAGAEPMSSVQPVSAEPMSSAQPIGADKNSSGNDDHVVGDDLC